METWLQMLVTVVCSIVASSGFWAYILKRHDKKDAKTEMLIGLAHDRIMTLGDEYIERGWLSRAEYENLSVYLYKPYSKIGGNGSAEKIMDTVEDLPICTLKNREVSINRNGGEKGEL